MKEDAEEDKEEDIKKNLLEMEGKIKRVLIDDSKRTLFLDVKEGETDAESFKRYMQKQRQEGKKDEINGEEEKKE